MDRKDIREDAKRIIDSLPPDATWDDLMYRIYERKSIEAGLADSDAGRIVPLDEVRARYGLK